MLIFTGLGGTPIASLLSRCRVHYSIQNPDIVCVALVIVVRLNDCVYWRLESALPARLLQGHGLINVI